MKEILDEFIKEICSTCKGECHKGITFTFGEIKKVQCLDYIKDESKINKFKKDERITAKKKAPIMKNII